MTDSQNHSGSPQTPTDLPKESLIAVAKRARVEFRNDNLTTLAAALTYYGVLAMVPGLLVLFTAIGFFGKGWTNKIVREVNNVAPGSAGHFVHNLLTQVQQHKSGTGIAALVGLAIALWSASGYVNGFRQAANIIYGVPEGRPIWKTYPMRLAVTIVAVIILVACALIVVVSGSIANEVGNALGIGHGAVTAWNVAKWFLLVILVSLLLAILYWATPNVKQSGIRWISPGGVIATILWIVFSALFALYVTNFGSYNKTYGSLAGIVIFLIWLYLSNIAVLFGAEVNAELEHAKAIAEGLPPDVEPFAEPRDTRKMEEQARAKANEARHARQN
jgi:membrane protein